MRNLRMMTLGILALVVVLMVPLAASASHAWGNYHWAREFDVALPLSLGDNVSGAWQSHLTQANDDWNAISTVLDNTIDSGRTSPRKCSPSDGLVEICNAKYGKNGWLGIAGIWASGDHITKGYVKLNDTYFDTASYDTADWRQLVMCQEIGHVFGLGHQDEEFANGNLNTCMDYTNSPASNTQPNAHDAEQLATIYNHTDGFNSYAAAPVPDDGGGGGGGGKGGGNGGGRGKPADVPGATVSDWGRAIGSDSAGRPNLFELNLGDGNRAITHVFWAD
jgi:hypothetical protein